MGLGGLRRGGSYFLRNSGTCLACKEGNRVPEEPDMPMLWKGVDLTGDIREGSLRRSWQVCGMGG